jgi:DNA-binding CsgD family transcriptional regulator
MSLAKYEEAHAMLAEALPLLREVGNPYRIAMALNFSGDLARCERKYDDARAFYEECISLLRGLDAPRDLASALQNLGYTCLHLGDIERGGAFFQEAMNLQVAQQNTPGIAECLMGFAATAIESRLPAAGARLLAAALKIRGQRLASAWAATKMEYEHYVSLLSTRLKEHESKKEQMIGTALTQPHDVEFAQQLFPMSETKAGFGQKTDDLSAREREIAGLIALGKTNGEIAEELVLSKRTIEKHVAHILMKLGAMNRAQIVRWAMENGLVKSTH